MLELPKITFLIKDFFKITDKIVIFVKKIILKKRNSVSGVRKILN